jgi:hypothetical protein
VSSLGIWVWISRFALLGFGSLLDYLMVMSFWRVSSIIDD